MKYIVHLRTTCSAFDYLDKLEVDSFKGSKVAPDLLTLRFQGGPIEVPLSNVLCIERIGQ